MTDYEKQSWVCEKEDRLFHTPIVDLVQQDRYLSNNHSIRHRFYLLRAREWVNIIPVTKDGNVVMVKQYRVGTESHTIEIPGGVVDHAQEDLQKAAIREMTEETGYAPTKDANCVYLGNCFSNPAILDNKSHSFIVGPVARTKEQNTDPTEFIEVVEIPISELDLFDESLSHGLIRHAFFLLLSKQEGFSSLLSKGLEKFKND